MDSAAIQPTNGVGNKVSGDDAESPKDPAVKQRFERLSAFVYDECQRRLHAYEAQPRDATEHFEIENDILSGGYAYRQLFELVQNGADAILESGADRGRIYVRLSPDRLEVANTGAELDQGGIVALLNARSSRKRGNQIGRFGIGFKSLLKLGGCVEIVSRSIGLRFDPPRCRQLIRDHLGLAEDAPAPGMRLAEVLDPDMPDGQLSADGDYSWATTVVSATIANDSVFNRLAEEMAGFPAEFLLFLPANIELDLATEGGDARSLSKRVDGDEAVVFDGMTESRWKLFETKVHISDPEARSDATHIQARDEIPLSWAVPLAGRDTAGRFWAFFPTETHTLTSGILNAPWKLNSDRTNLIRGPWNTAIMAEAAQLIAESLPLLATPEDYGAPLGAFPRKPDRLDEIAVPLAKAIWGHIVNAAVLPNGNSALCRPSEIANHCVEDEDICLEWGQLAGQNVRDRFLHPDCYKNTTRISRLHALKDEATRRDIKAIVSPSCEKWLEKLATSLLPKAKRVIRFAGKIIENRYRYGCSSKPSPRIIVANDGSLLKPSEAVIPNERGTPAGFVAVADELTADSQCRDVLVNILGVKDFLGSPWTDILDASLLKAAQTDTSDGWEQFWSNLADAPPKVAGKFIAAHGAKKIKFKTLAGSWSEHGLVAIPDESDPVSDEYALDLDFLQGIAGNLPDGLWNEFPLGDEFYRDLDEALYKDLRSGRGVELESYCQWVSRYFVQICWKSGSRIPRYRPTIKTGHLIAPKGWRMLSTLSPKPAARLSLHLLRMLMEGQPVAQPVVLEHPTRPKAYPRPSAPHPIWFFLALHGYIQIGEQAIPLAPIDLRQAECLARAGIPGFDALEFMIQKRDENNDLQDRLQWNAAAKTSADAEPFWKQVFCVLVNRKEKFRDLSDAWELAYSEGVIPEHLPTADGPKPLNSIHVSTFPAADDEPDDGRVVFLPHDVAKAWIEAGAQSLDGGPAYIYESICAPPARLLDIFPEMTVEPELAELLDHVDAIWVKYLETRHGPRSYAVEVALESNQTVLLDREFFNKEGRAAGVRSLFKVMARCRLIPEGERFNQILENVIERRVEEARTQVRCKLTLTSRLLQAVGGTAAPLLELLASSIRQALSNDALDETIADLALAVYGPSILSRLKSTFKAQGLMPPDRWGCEQAREFVTDIGFPVEFASSVSRRRDAALYVSGPMPLPPLHDYQENILDDIKSLIDAGNARRRAVVSLPTGGGKTRVVAEAIVKLVLRGKGRRTALWIAQTDELCEQAVQCFRQLWINLGEEGEDLRIIRLWGGQRNPVPPENEDAVVVIASIQTLNSRRGYEQIAWITRPGIIVVDECHHAITRSYTDLMRWLDLQVGGERERSEEPPMLGLSATPWRGYNEDESRLLAKRFDNRWIPSDQAYLHDKLSEMGVLSHRNYRALPYNRPIQLSHIERSHTEQFGELPDSVLDRISDDDKRNELIVKAVSDSDAKSILLFANSVAHAQYLAARLHLEGCSAAAVSGDTDSLARQHFIRKFRDNDLRVICNCRVLTTGFDAPKADMILISQPVFSPVMYMQMVGRGLRGELNGGTPQCEIVTVEDNIVNYSDRLAYHFCRRYFDQ